MDEQKGKRRKRRMWMCDGTGQHKPIFFEGLGLDECPLCKLMGKVKALMKKLGVGYKPSAQS